MLRQWETLPRGRAVPAERRGAPFPWGLAATLVVTMVWRLPSFFDPPWVNDEGTYFAIAQAIGHGYRLYGDIWENKPPALYMVYFAVYHLWGPSLIALRVLSALSALALVLLTYGLSRRFCGRQQSLVAAMFVGLMMGVPFLEGTTANAEVFLAVLSAGGMYCALVLDRPFVAGLALGAAILFKVVAGFDALALALWLWRTRERNLYLAGLGLPVGLTLLVSARLGILGPMVRDALLYDFGYVGHGNGAHIPWLLGSKLVALVLLAIWLRDKPFPYLWLVFAAAAALVSGRFFGHYALQAVVPLGVCVALGLRTRSAWSARLVSALPVACLLLAAVSALVGWGFAAAGHDTILARRLQWYANFARLALHAENYSAYRAQVDDHVSRNLAVVTALESLPPGLLLVWGNTPWVYPLSHRLPATAYTSALRNPEVPGETADLRHVVAEHRARVVVVITPAQPPLGQASPALYSGYRKIGTIANAEIYVRKVRVSRSRSARTTASVNNGTR